MGQVVTSRGMVAKHFLPYCKKNDPRYGTLWISSTIDHIEHQQEVLQLLKDNLNLAQNQMKQQADQHLSERSFDVRD